MRFRVALTVLLLILSCTQVLAFDQMQIELLVGALDGDDQAQAVQLRMRNNGMGQVDNGRLVVYDQAGQNPVVLAQPNGPVFNQSTGSTILFATPNFSNATVPVALPDFTMVPIPPPYLGAGSITWEDLVGNVFWRVSWGFYFGPTNGLQVNDADGNFGVLPFDLPVNGPNDKEAVVFNGPPSAPSTLNDQDYFIVTDPYVVQNNAGNLFELGGPPQFGGYETLPLGQAQATLSPEGNLVISNIGSSGLDGVSIDLGPAEDAGFRWLPLPPLPADADIRVEAFGTINGADQSLGTSRSVVDPNGDVQLETDFSAVGVNNYRIELYDQGQQVFVGPSTGLLSGTVNDMPEQCLYIENQFVDPQPGPLGLAPIDPLPGFQWHWSQPQPYEVPGAGIIFCDEVRLFVDAPIPEYEALHTLVVTATDPLASFQLVLERVFGSWKKTFYEALGAARPVLNALGQLVVSNIGSSGEDGVRFVPPPETSGIRLEYDGLNGLPLNGNRSVVDILGILAPDTVGPYLQFGLEEGPQGVAIDSQPLVPTTGLQVEVLDINGLLLEDTGTLTTHPVITSTQWPESTGWTYDPATHTLEAHYFFSNNTDLTISGNTNLDASELLISYFDVVLFAPSMFVETRFVLFDERDLIFQTVGQRLSEPPVQFVLPGDDFTATGNATIGASAAGNFLFVDDLGSSGQDGVQMAFPASTTRRIEYELPDTGPVVDINLIFAGEVQNQFVDVTSFCWQQDPVLGLWSLYDIQVPLVPSFNGWEIRIWDDSILQTTLPLLPLGPIDPLTGSSSPLAVGAGLLPGPQGLELQLQFLMPEGTQITLPGGGNKMSFTADFIQIVPLGTPDPLDGITSATMTAQNTPFFFVTNNSAESTATAAPELPFALGTALMPASPNPFNPRTTISFELAHGVDAAVRIFSLDGRLVDVLHQGFLEPGHHSRVWNGLDRSGRNVASGVYLVELETPGRQQTQKVTLVK